MYSIDDIILFMTLTYFIPCSISPFLFFFYFFPLHPHFYSSAAHNATSTFHTKFKYRYEIFFILYRDKAKGHNYIFQFFIYPFILIYFFLLLFLILLLLGKFSRVSTTWSDHMFLCRVLQNFQYAIPRSFLSRLVLLPFTTNRFTTISV